MKINFKKIAYRILMTIVSIALLVIAFSIPEANAAEGRIYEMNNDDDLPKTKIVIPEHEGYLMAVYKDQHKMYLYKDNEIIKEYDVNIRRELADRAVWEDNQTPEGMFYIETMDYCPSPAWARWMRVNTSWKAREIYVENHADGLERIQKFEAIYGEIESDDSIRKFNALNPDQKMFRGVGVHGGGFFKDRDWTIGCVALADADVIELFNILKTGENGGIGTPIIIQD